MISTAMSHENAPEDRLRELAAILAPGVLRLHEQRLRVGNPADLSNPPESAATAERAQ